MIRVLSGKLRNNSSGISSLHRIFDAIVTLYIFIFNIVGNYKINIYFYGILIYLISTFVLKDLYKSYRTTTIQDLSWDVFIRLIMIIMVISTLSFFLYPIGLIFSSVKYKFFFFSIYIFISHIGSRILLRKYRLRGGNTRTIMILGNLEFRKKIDQELIKFPWMGFKVVSWFACTNDFSNWSIKPDGEEKDIKFWLNKNIPDLIIFSQDDIKDSMENLLTIFGNTSYSISYFANWLNPNMSLTSNSFGDLKIISIWNKPQSLIQVLAKEIVDKLISLALIILITPILFIIALALKLTTKNDFLYIQERVGLNGEIFKIYKFRTMVVSESGMKKNLKQATLNDARITRLGYFLRKYSLDELPQLFNVLKGEMSLVGPRPHAFSHNEFYRKEIRGYMQRHRIKPGITGLAQINGCRGETKSLFEMQKRIHYDLKYIENWTILLDFEILFKTIFHIKANK